MKPVIVLCFVATNAMALDFNSEWAKFDNDFAKLKSKPVILASNSPVVITPIPAVPVEDRSIVLLEKNTQSNVLQQVDPKSSSRLGFKLSDPNMRDRVVEAYNKPNAVVYSLTLE
jgi:hypothetical protein